MERYDVVLATDVDEIVTPIPERGTLGEYIDEFDEWWVNCIGYEILHMADREAPIDPTCPILDQRGYWFANGGYNKPALASGPMEWEPGFHHRVDGRVNYDPDLWMVHLHRMDLGLCRERHRVRRGRGWGERDLDEGWAAYNRAVEEGELEEWFYTDSGFEESGRRSSSSAYPKPGGDGSERARPRRSRSARGAPGYEAARRLRRVADPIRFPEAHRPLQHWQRVLLNDDVSAFLDSIGAERLSCAEISGDTHAGLEGGYSSLMYPEFDLLEPDGPSAGSTW